MQQIDEQTESMTDGGKAKVLLLMGKQSYHSFQFKTGEPTTLQVNNQGDSQTVYSFTELSAPIKLEFDGFEMTANGQILPQNETIAEQDVFVWWGDQPAVQTFDLSGLNELVVGPHEFDEVTLSNHRINFKLSWNQTGGRINDFGNRLFINHQLKNDDFAELAFGDQLFIDGILFELRPGTLLIQNMVNGGLTSKLIQLPTELNQFPTDYPVYHRSPRIIYRLPEDTIKIKSPMTKPTSPDNQLAKVVVPPLIMVAMAILMSMFGGRNALMMLSMVGMSVTTVVFSITAYFRSKKEYKIKLRERSKEYDRYLRDETAKLYQLSQKQTEALKYHYPNLTELGKMIDQVNSRIYEKTAMHHDFLTYRLGSGTMPSSYKIGFEDDPFNKDELFAETRQMVDTYHQVDNVPVISDLMHGPVGIVGPRPLVIESLHAMALQIATLQSYHDVQFISIFPEAELDQWKWMRWLPHATLQGMNVRGFVYHERSRDQILNSLYQILKDRENELKEQGQGSEQKIFMPHYIVFATHEELILDHTIMEYLSKDISELGVSVVFVEEVMQSLPEQVKTVIDIADQNHGKIVIEQGVLKDTSFIPDHFPVDFDKELVARQLGALDHQESLKNSIPTSVTFMEMYGKKRVEELQIAQRWQQNEPFKSLAVPLGLRGKDDIVKLDLHERAHGPHGLIAGTTGSGKSELVQSYILSLAVNFQPNDVGFLLIDYKGGGMANLFRNLPHLLGAITNLDGAQSMRALDSIKAELRRRQRLFGQFDVNHINAYQKLFKEGTATEPMPHLFLISDEFAELKTGQPEFMDELVSTARIGRSLGIHLILATQKPTGVVDDQIWSNSKFKISLKVQDVADSKEILKTPDAASIVEPGRAYLQVGNNEIYELFQSAWSGANYVPDAEKEQVDHTIYAINELGQYELLTKDLSQDNQESDNQAATKTQLDTIIEYIEQYAKDNGIKRLPRPWLPPLAERIFIDNIQSYIENWQKPINPKFEIGVVDIPSEQDQRPLTFDLTEDSHTAIFGSAGYGKSTFLQTMVMQLARQNNPEQLTFYLLDFGTNGLLSLRDLPHVADIIRADETAKLTKYMKLISDEIKKRKRLLNKAGVATLPQYATATGDKLPIIENVIDAFDAISNTKFEDQFREIAGAIAREGASLGIYLIISASARNSLRMQLSANIKTQMSLYLIDKDEISNIVGRTKMTVDDMPGRGLIKLDEPRLFQTYLPAEGEDSLQIIESVQAEAKDMDEAWTGNKPKEIPMVPDDLDYQGFFARQEVQQAIDNNIVPLGLDFQTTLPVGMRSDQPYFVLANDTRAQFDNFTSMIQMLMEYLGEEVIVFDASATILPKHDGQQSYQTEDEFKMVIDQLSQVTPDSTAEMDSLLVINDLEQFIETAQLDAHQAEFLTNELASRGIRLLINTYEEYMRNNFDEIIKIFKKPLQNGTFGNRINDQALVQTTTVGREPFVESNESYYFQEREISKFKIPTETAQ